MRKIAFAAILMLLAASASAARAGDSPAERLRGQIRDRGVDPHAVVVPFELDDEMRTWLRESAQTGGDPERRLEQLLHDVLHRTGVEVTYQQGVTATAREVWRTNRANCLGFTHLYVGLAREIGLPVYYLRVTDLENFEKDGDLIVASDHVTAAYGPPNRRRVVDFTERKIPEYHVTEPLTDLTAVALHYSNLGAERIRDGQFAEAEPLLRTSIKLDPNLGDGWVNLGVAMRRLGRAEEAETMFRRALEVNPRLLAGYHNLAALLERQGRREEARRLLQLTDRRTNRNPFSYLALGDLAMREGRVREAERFYRSAQRIHSDRAEPLAALGQSALARGDRRAAQRWLEKAMKIDPKDPRAADLERTLIATPPSFASSAEN